LAYCRWKQVSSRAAGKLGHHHGDHDHDHDHHEEENNYPNFIAHFFLQLLPGSSTIFHDIGHVHQGANDLVV
jgi:hypothetical protein